MKHPECVLGSHSVFRHCLIICEFLECWLSQSGTKRTRIFLQTHMASVGHPTVYRYNHCASESLFPECSWRMEPLHHRLCHGSKQETEQVPWAEHHSSSFPVQINEESTIYSDKWTQYSFAYQEFGCKRDVIKIRKTEPGGGG